MNSLPNHKILGFSKLKPLNFVYDKLKVVHSRKYVLSREEYIVEK